MTWHCNVTLVYVISLNKIYFFGETLFHRYFGWANWFTRDVLHFRYFRSFDILNQFEYFCFPSIWSRSPVLEMFVIRFLPLLCWKIWSDSEIFSPIWNWEDESEKSKRNLNFDKKCRFGILNFWHRSMSLVYCCGD